MGSLHIYFVRIFWRLDISAYCFYFAISNNDRPAFDKIAGNFIKSGSIVIRNGKIEAVGRYIKSPKDSYEIDMQGAHIYAGFLETWLETKSYDSKSKSKRKHWDSKVRPDYRAVDNIEIKDKALKELRSLGFTTAHLAPVRGELW